MPVHAATIVLSAFLLFVVQPVVARQILPWFGGTAAVWTTCMVFFQTALLAGYAYSDALARRWPLRRQVLVHGALLALSLAALPIVAPASLRPAAGTNPWARIVLLLTVTVGLPYFLLSTTGPLLQAWAARGRAGDRVYRLYALSNLASMAGLAAYPFVIEPVLPVRAQALLWSWGYGLFVAAAMGSAVLAWRGEAALSTAGGVVRPPAPAAGDAGALPVRRQLAVLSLAALGSVLLLAVTGHLTRDVAAIPFLWLLPLLLYLLSFVICFDRPAAYRRGVWVPVTAVLVVAMLAVDAWRPLELRLSLPLHALGLFAACMTCHGELVLRRPGPARLTTFYLMVALGGVVGGLLVAVVAPLVFRANLELPLALCAVAAVVYVATPGRLRFVGAAALLAACGMAAVQVRDARAGAVASSRNFYGALKITRAPRGDGEAVLQLVHGVILHGEQVPTGPERRLPTSYYGTDSGVGRALRALRPSSLRVGVVGLGVGTLAVHGRPGDVFRFYELDPDVERHARSTFHYLEDTPAAVEVVIGDGRLALEREPPQGFDLIAVDAFSSDAIPVHLLTREALAAYRRHLREGGVLAFHVSNRYLDLAPVVRSLADQAGLAAWRIEDSPEDRTLLAPSTWVLVTSNAELLARFAAEEVGDQVPARGDLRPWTDDYSNLFQVVRFRSDAKP